LFSYSLSNEGNAGSGGAISLKSANGSITTGGLFSYSYSQSGNAGNGGEISLTAANDINNITGDLTEGLYSFSYSKSGTAGNGGAISLVATGGNISGQGNYSTVLGSFSLSEQGSAGNGGNVALEAKNKVSNLEILTLSSSSQSGTVQVTGLGDLSLTNTNIVTSKQVSVQTPFGNITLDVGGEGQSGNVDVTSTGNLTFDNSSIESDTKGSDPAGNVTISSPGLVTFNNSKIISNTSNIGNAGDIEINAGQGITLQGLYSHQDTPRRGGLFAETTNSGNAGKITLTTPELTLQNGAEIATTTTSSGAAGNITLQSHPNEENLNINLEQGTSISASTNSTLAPNSQVSASTSGSGKGGDLILSAPQAITITGQGRLAVESLSTGDAGNVLVTTPQFTLTDGVELSAAATSSGKAGEIRLNTQQLTLDKGAQILASNVSSSSKDIILEGLDTLTVSNNSAITASTQTGQAGSLSINANSNPATSVQVSNNSRLSVEATAGGTAGNLSIKAGQVSVQDGGAITVSSPSGQAGNLNITANSLFLNRGKLTAETGASGTEGANINLSGLELLVMQNESLISAEAFNQANGGNISIDTKFVIALTSVGPNGSDITANAFQGNGGNIQIQAVDIIGIEQRRAIDGNRTNDIDASSEYGAAGQVKLNTLINTTQRLTELPTQLVDPSRQIAQECAATGDNQNKFTVTGRGGLPQSPTDVISPDMVQDDLGTPIASNPPTGESVKPSPTTPPKQLVEAQGWVVDDKGVVTLVAAAPTVTPHSPALTPASCQESLGQARQGNEAAPLNK
jgi:large exoprotein involved in heme utilization and adhesion